MSEAGKTAYITGGASGIGLAVTKMLASKGAKVFIADINAQGASPFASELNTKDTTTIAFSHACDVTSWDSQLASFEAALKAFNGRIDYVYPIAGIGEKQWIPNDPSVTSGFTKPNLAVMDADATGVMYTVALAVQQMRRQPKDERGFRGKIGCVASVCGFYCTPTLPIYTAAKHATVGLTRSYGQLLAEDAITMNAICPNVLRTNISSSAFYDMIESKGLLSRMEDLIEAFESLLGDSTVSGQCFEILPKKGWKAKPGLPYTDKETELIMSDLLYQRSHVLHEPKRQT